MDTTKSIMKILHDIFIINEGEIERYNSRGLFGGPMGLYMFKANYAMFSNTDYAYGTTLERLIEKEFTNNNITFSTGQSGLNWYYYYLVKKGLIEKEDYENFSFNHAALKDFSLRQLGIGNFDFLHGALGIAYSLLFANDLDLDYFERFFSTLSNLRKLNTVTHSFANFLPDQNKTIVTEINLSLSHGIASILKFCIECYNKKVCSDKAKSLAYYLASSIQEYANKETQYCYFPNIVNVHKIGNENSRLAWCYGDLGIAYILYQFGTTFDEKKLRELALEVLYHTTKRKDFEQTRILDAGICHGTAGVAHIYNRLWNYTRDNNFKKSADFWISKTLDFANQKDGFAGYKMYLAQYNKFVPMFGLLEGTAGVGQVLLSYINNDFSWDYCLMLND